MTILQEPILVVGGYGYRNVGDEAILAGLLTTLGGRRVTVVSRSPAETTVMHGVQAIPVVAALRALGRHRTVLIGGGGIFGRDMGRIGRLLPLFGLLAKALGRRVVVEGVGVDPGMTGMQRFLVRRLLRAADRVTVRDETSARVLRDWGIAAFVAEDLSARLVAAPARIGRQLLRGAGIDERRPVVGLCLTGVNDGLTAAVSDAVADLVERRPELQFCLVPMSQHPFVDAHNDLLLARALQRSCPQLKVVETFQPPAAVLSLFGALDAVVAMRYHAYLFAERAGVPLIPIAYADKSLAWLAERGLQAVEPSGEGLSRALGTWLPVRSKAS